MTVPSPDADPGKAPMPARPGWRYRWLKAVLPLRLRTSLAFRVKFPDLTSAIRALPSAALRFAPGFSMRLHPTDTAHRQIWLTGFMELGLSRLLTSEARKGGLLVDVGANAGYFTLLWLAAGDGNLAYCCEPGSRPAEYLRANLEINGVAGRAKVDRRAVGSMPGRMLFSPGEEAQTGWGGLTTKPTAESVEVDVVVLDEIFPPSTPIRVLKIDVEGADTWVLEGAERLLAAGSIGTVFFEHNEIRMRALGVDPKRAVQFLGRFGYLATPIPGTRETEWLARRR